MPVVIPQRVTTELVERFKQSRFSVWIVIHANHASELDTDVLQRVGSFIDAGIPVLNQAVLLRGVNDDVSTLIRLSQVLVNHRIQPYYLHQLDRVRGAAHFEVPVREGVQADRRNAKAASWLRRADCTFAKKQAKHQRPS